MKPVDPRLLRHARAARRHITVCVVLGTVAAALVLVQADVLSRGVAGVVEGHLDLGSLAPVLAGLAAVVAGRALVAGLTDGAAQRASADAKRELRGQLVAHAAALGPALPEVGRAEVATLAGEGLDDLDAYFDRYLPQLVLAVVVPALVVARLFTVDLTAALTVVLTVPLIPVFMVLIGMATEAATERRWVALSRLSHHFLDVVTGLATLKAFGRAAAQEESVERVTDDYRRSTMATLRLAFLSSLALELLATLSVALVAVGVGLRLVHGDLDLQTGLLVIILAPEAYLPIREVGVRFHAAADGLAASDRVFAVLETPLAPCGEHPPPDLRNGGVVRVEAVSVDHAGRDLLAPDGATFEVRPGEVIALVGPSGVGKSTMLAVLLGAVAPTTGRVIVDAGGFSVDLADIDRDAWRRNLSWVDQTPYLASGTVADNVRIAAPDASDDQVWRALDLAELTHLPLDRAVGEGGRGLSAGERRRIGLARAALRDAPLVLLDEPTAGLDQVTEAAVLRAVRRLAADRAVVMAAHRPAAITIADRVVAVTSRQGAPIEATP